MWVKPLCKSDVFPPLIKDLLLAYLHFLHLSRLLLDGAPLIAIHKARYYKRKDGLALGPGPFVTALEYATDTKAIVVGKPEKTFFLEALRDTGCAPEEAVMIGDVSIRAKEMSWVICLALRYSFKSLLPVAAFLWMFSGILVKIEMCLTCIYEKPFILQSAKCFMYSAKENPTQISFFKCSLCRKQPILKEFYHCCLFSIYLENYPITVSISKGCWPLQLFEWWGRAWNE